ncbi:2739_t:CDS:2 [Acaulospora colombiana]|uniref:2739_t:CDS:1 n=1 Tax=Acaulospora colombiana TaxID=27376 RepID=A0ACA9N0Q4_9GLOM|nr:2739_t:CDS:2 [Acaulospora colombiana]
MAMLTRKGLDRSLIILPLEQQEERRQAALALDRRYRPIKPEVWESADGRA